MKKFILSLTFFLLIFFIPLTVVKASTPRLLVNTIEITHIPIGSNDGKTSWIPLRPLATLLGATTEWLPETKEIILTKREYTFKAPLQDKTIFKQIEGTTYIATTAIPKAFNCTLEFEKNTIFITSSFTQHQLQDEALKLLTSYITNHNTLYPTTPILNTDEYFNFYITAITPNPQNPLVYNVTAHYTIENLTTQDPLGRYEDITASFQLFYENQTFHMSSLKTIDSYHYNTEAPFLTPDEMKSFNTIQYKDYWLKHSGFTFKQLIELLDPSTSFLADGHLVKNNAYIKGSNGVSYAKYMNQPFYKQLSTSSAFNAFTSIPFKFEPEFYPISAQKNGNKLSVTFVILTSVLPPHPIVTMTINYVITPEGLQPISIENMTSYNDMLAFKQQAYPLFELYVYHYIYTLYTIDE